MRALLIALALVATLSLNGAPTPPPRPNPGVTDGCALYVSVPNPCDPESNN